LIRKIGFAETNVGIQGETIPKLWSRLGQSYPEVSEYRNRFSTSQTREIPRKHILYICANFWPPDPDRYSQV